MTNHESDKLTDVLERLTVCMEGQPRARESSLTLKSGLIVSLMAGMVIYTFTALINHERRITVVETNQANNVTMLTTITANIGEIKSDLKEHQRATIELRDTPAGRTK